MYIISTMETPRQVEGVLSALGEQLERAGAYFELVVIGGSALVALGFVGRATRDIDVVALEYGGEFVPADPLPPALATAAAYVARDFDLPPDWLNPGPTELLRFGLPEGFAQRTVRQEYGPALVVHFAGRLDQIHLKLYAVADQGAGRHEADLRALDPSREELLAAARWARTHDPSPGFLHALHSTLAVLGVDDADLGA
jgi:hypothetical protein